MTYVALFLAALLEGLVVIGLFVPGTAFVVGAAAAARAGELSTTGVLFASALGATIGGFLSYFVGLELYAWKRLQPWLARHHAAIHRSRALVERWGVLSVVVGACFGPTRAFVPMLAGAGRMPVLRFGTAMTVGALLWASLTVLAGGSAFALYQRLPWEWSVAVAVALVAGWLAVRLIRGR